MNWYKKAITEMKLDWDTAYKELLELLGREPTTEEIRQKMYDASEAPFMNFDQENNYEDIPF